MDGLDLLVEVILFLRLLHLPLHARLDGAIHVQFFNFNIENLGDAREAFRGIKDFEQFLLFFNRKLKIGGDGVGQLCRIFHADGCDHGFVVKGLAELYVLFEERGDPLHRGFELCIGFDGVTRQANCGLHESLAISDLSGAPARPVLGVDGLQPRGGQVERLLPRRLAEVRHDLVVVHEPAGLLAPTPALVAAHV